MAGFRNTLYKESWEKYVGTTKNEFADGTYFEEGDTYAVYDGAQNIMGYITKKGAKMTTAGEATEYNESFLKAARVELVKLGKVAVEEVPGVWVD